MRPSATDDWCTWVSDVRVRVLFTSEPRVSGQYKRWRDTKGLSKAERELTTTHTHLAHPALRAGNHDDLHRGRHVC